MKILFVAFLVSIHSKRWIEFFSRREDTEVQVLCFGRQAFPIEGAVVHAMGEEAPWKSLKGIIGRIRLWASRRRKIDQVNRDFRPDLVHIHWLCPKALRAALRFRVPIVATAWGSDVLIEPLKSFWQRRAVIRTLKMSKCVTCDAAHLKERMIAFGAEAEKIHIINFGTNCEEYSPANRDPGLVSQLGWSKSDLLVMSLRALNPIYDIETLIRAVPLGAAKAPQARFVIVGDGEQKEFLKNLSGELGVSQLVHFAGRLSDADMKRYSASADVYVSTSTSDAGLAASTAEAMASGVPVVITDFGNNADWLQEESAGRLFPIRDHTALAARIVELLANEKLRKKMGEAGREIILERNSYHREMERMRELYKSLLS